MLGFRALGGRPECGQKDRAEVKEVRSWLLLRMEVWSA